MKRRKRPNHRSRQASTRKLLIRDGPRCVCCEVKFTLDNPPTLEHLVALQDGGTNVLANLILLCERCNHGREHNTGTRVLAQPVVTN